MGGTNRHGALSPAANRILAALPAADLERLAPRLESRALAPGEVLQETGERLEYMYFPIAGMLSSLAVLEDGESLEVLTAGREGCSGIEGFFGSDESRFRVVVQLEGRGYRMRTEAVRAQIVRTDALRAQFGRYADLTLTLLAQSAVCNRLHPVDRRCARWLVAAHDRASGDSFPITHEGLSEILGVRRASVSVAAASLQDLALIHYRHGRVTVTDRPGLEACACECYRVMRAQYARMWD